MDTSSSAQQQSIIDWFDSVYRRKGSRYLRPTEAYIVFLELLGARSRHTLLDVACGTGVLLKAAANYTSNLFGMDVSNVAVAEARKQIAHAEITHANAENLPYDDENFDLVTCLGSLERMLNVSQALSEIRRVGKDSARFCFMVRNSNTLSWKYLSAFMATQRAEGHAGADTLRNWTRLFESRGFVIKSVWPDQYPLHRRKRMLSMYQRKIDFKKPVCGNSPIDRANEFIFILEKQK